MKILVYIAGLLQGLALVAFPAASSILTGPDFNLSAIRYGMLFIPQALLSILCSLLTTRIGGNKVHFFIGMIANFLSMALFALAGNFYTLLLATAFLGIGFGFTVPTLNTLASLYFPKQVDRAVLILNTLLGLGTALAPLLTALFIGYDMWRGLPLLIAFFILALIILSAFLPFPESEKKVDSSFSSVFWLFAAFALGYGIIETLSGNWATIYMAKVQHADVKTASLALTLFWAMVTLGRLFFSLFNAKVVFHTLPFVAAVAFLLLMLQENGLFAFALAGIGCSALLPLAISFSETMFPAGWVVAFYLLGYGIAAFGVGPLQEVADLKEIFGLGAALAAGLGVLSFIVKESS